jgi:hypothetical protein
MTFHDTANNVEPPASAGTQVPPLSNQASRVDKPAPEPESGGSTPSPADRGPLDEAFETVRTALRLCNERRNGSNLRILDWPDFRKTNKAVTKIAAALTESRAEVGRLARERDALRGALDEIVEARYEGTGLTSDEMRFVARTALSATGGTEEGA